MYDMKQRNFARHARGIQKTAGHLTAYSLKTEIQGSSIKRRFADRSRKSFEILIPEKLDLFNFWFDLKPMHTSGSCAKNCHLQTFVQYFRYTLRTNFLFFVTMLRSAEPFQCH